jgi:hypothetical protein
MKEFCTAVYKTLLIQLDQIAQTDHPFIHQIENAYIVSFHHWLLVTKKMSAYTFIHEQEEILFFKKIKPLFTSQIEYYNLLYHFELFKPDHSVKKMTGFIAAEKDRLKKFITANGSFYFYYKKGCTHFDAVYFTRAARLSPSLLLKPYNIEPRLVSSHDHLVAQCIALKKYFRRCHSVSINNTLRASGE